MFSLCKKKSELVFGDDCWVMVLCCKVVLPSPKYYIIHAQTNATKVQLSLDKGLRKKTKGFEKRPFKILLKNQVDESRYFSQKRLRRVLRKKAAVVIHLHTLTSAAADLHLHTFTSADPHLHTFTSADPLCQLANRFVCLCWALAPFPLLFRCCFSWRNANLAGGFAGRLALCLFGFACLLFRWICPQTRSHCVSWWIFNSVNLLIPISGPSLRATSAIPEGKKPSHLQIYIFTPQIYIFTPSHLLIYIFHMGPLPFTRRGLEGGLQGGASRRGLKGGA